MSSDVSLRSFSDGNLAELLRYFFVNAVFLNFLAPSVGTLLSNLEADTINGSLWTLKNEVAFYVLVPALFALRRKYNLPILSILYVCSVAYMIYFIYFNQSQYIVSQVLTNERMLVQFPAQLRLFISGIFLYIFFDRLARSESVIIALLCGALIILFRSNDLFRVIAYPLVMATLLFYLVYGLMPIIIKFDFSYSFYILHFPLIQMAVLFNFNPSNSLISFLLLFGLTLLLSYLSEYTLSDHLLHVVRN